MGGLFNGAGPTAARAMALNLGMLGGNAQAKQILQDAGLTGQTLVFSASAIAGFFASAFSLHFDFVKTQMQKQKPDPVTGELPFKSSMDCVMKTMAGGIAAVIGNPADLALIRMQADAMLPEAERRGYRHVGHALSSIASNEGAMGLFNGAGPTAARAMALNLGML